jgi:ATP-dependent Clp protease adaptor protein ClpS
LRQENTCMQSVYQIQFSERKTQICEEDVSVLEDERLLFVHNDDVNTFDWVIKSLIDICKHDNVQAEQCTYIIHYQGKCQVSHGPEKLMMKRQQELVNRGILASVI